MTETITRQEVHYLFDYDPKTGFIYWKNKPSIRKSQLKGKRAGSRSGEYSRHRSIIIKGKKYLEHRVIWFFVNGYWPIEIDHIDGDGHNNKWDNLREVDRLTNSQNKSIGKNNSSGILGVYWDARRGKWVAGIKINKKYIYIGSFDLLETAAIERRKAEFQYGYHPNHGRPQRILDGGEKDE